MGIHIIPRRAQRLFNLLRRVVPDNAGAKSFKAGIVIPPNRHMRKIWHSELSIHARPFLVHVGHDLSIVAVNIREMAELVIGKAVETKLLRFPGQRCARAAVHAAHVAAAGPPMR